MHYENSLLVHTQSFAKSTSDRYVHFYHEFGEIKPITIPVPANEFRCPFCNSKDFHLYSMGNKKNIWICGSFCERSTQKNDGGAISTQVKSQRALEWPLFCERNRLGDEVYAVKFELVDQSAGKVQYMQEFLKKPKGIIYMQGDPGLGKTYAALAMCEFFTRTSTSCFFLTQKQLGQDWQLTCMGMSVNNLIQRIEEVELLVIDDFGTGDIPPKFMAYFMDLINTRLQWSNRGTVITTNLSDNDFSDYCGAALTNRIQTGQLFQFSGKSRRKKVVL